MRTPPHVIRLREDSGQHCLVTIADSSGESSHKQDKLMTMLPQKTYLSVCQFAAEGYSVPKVVSRDSFL